MKEEYEAKRRAASKNRDGFESDGGSLEPRDARDWYQGELDLRSEEDQESYVLSIVNRLQRGQGSRWIRSDAQATGIDRVNRFWQKHDCACYKEFIEESASRKKEGLFQLPAKGSSS